MRVLVAFTLAALLVALSLLALPALVHAHPLVTSYLAIRFRPAWRLVALAVLIICARRLRDHQQLRRFAWTRTRGGALAITFGLGVIGPITHGLAAGAPITWGLLRVAGLTAAAACLEVVGRRGLYAPTDGR